jgi:hypothetical protein
MNTTGSKTFEQFYILDLYTNNQVVGYGTKFDEGQLMVTSGDKTEFETLNDKYFSK